ncbi:MAG TPA: MBL fold metallo-hydrolase [Clostridiales bacterium]|nr:MBL fold metallo-hydrolase [Clostridiales bacterium]HBW05380.1 MBL fold metallo-hydrolase [Clostridiales bacterium]HCH92249.1 MBL fold metallo-hydrolase [Clostridiales bacterium]
MKITWLGHSSFLLEESTGTKIVTDPYNSYVGYEMPDVEADIVTVSHAHSDHCCVSKVSGDPTVLNRAGAYEIGGVHILASRSYHDDKKGNLRGDNLIFKYRMDGVDVCHMGDIGEECNAILVESIMPVNILMIPVGGNYTIDAKEAKEYVDRIMPDIVIPMHYKTKDCEFDIDKVNEFLSLFDDENIVYADSTTVEFDRADFDGEETKVLVLEKLSK